MGRFLTILKIEMKRALKSLPYFLAGAVVLAVLAGTIAFSANRIRDCIRHQTAFIKSDCITVAYDYVFIRAFSYCALFIYTS